MSLILTTLRCPETIPPQTRRVEGMEFSIGRGPENDWVLPDPNRHLSKRHCQLTFANGVWYVADTSTNGTFVNFDDVPVRAAGQRSLAHGDRLRLGMYELEVHIVADQPSPPENDDIDGTLGGSDDRTRVFRPLTPTAPRPPAAEAELDLLDFGTPFGEAAPPPVAAPPPAVAAPLATVPPFAEPAFEPAHVPPPSMEIPEDWNSDPFDIPAPAPSLTPAPPAAAPLQPATADLMAAFMRGAGIDKAPPADPEAAMEALGAAFRAVVAGVRQVLLARASIKSEFRIEQTMIRARGNNPLKFSTGDDDALASMLGLGRRSDMPAAEAVRDALRDMQLHELASMAAMQSAVKSLVAQFDPEKIRAGVDQGGMSLVPAQRKARAWEAFEALHARTTLALADDFDSVFGKAFAIAYEQTLHEASERADLP
jgi:type VI secretion system protein ImpI/type VI secretion system protein